MNNNSNKIVAGIVLATGIMLSGISASAAILVEWQDGTTAGHDFSGWTSEAYGTDGAAHFTIDEGAGQSQLDLDYDLSGGPSPGSDVHYTMDFTDTILSDYGSGGDNPYLQFTYYYDDSTGSQNGLGFYFAGAGATREWYYNIDSDYISSGWNTFRVQLDSGATAYGGGVWYEEGGADYTNFDVDLDAVSRVGFWTAYNDNVANNDYVGLYGVSVPEPETYLMLGMALLSVAVVFRKRISESMAEARAMMQV